MTLKGEGLIELNWLNFHGNDGINDIFREIGPREMLTNIWVQHCETLCNAHDSISWVFT